jgi:hypothetical protein
MHSCDNPPCVNPAHLSIGTQKDNTLDSIAKGRTGRRQRATACKECGAPRYPGTSRALCHEHFLDAIRRDRWRHGGEARANFRFDVQRPDLPLTFSDLVGKVGERRATVFARNFGLYGFDVPERLSDIGASLGVSTERARQIVARTCELIGIKPRTFWGRKVA